MQNPAPVLLAGTLMTTLSIGLSVAAATAQADPQQIEYWRTGASQAEIDSQQAAIDRFNHAQSQWHVEMSRLPAGSYTEAMTAAALTDDFRKGGRWRFFYDYAEAHARLRPATPGYPTISSAFERAARDIRDGRDMQESLDEAVDTIERDIADNRGYGFHE